MRADRLISLLMLLQSNRKMTARQLASTLEVSTRTIYRDIDALSFAGIPIYGETGPGGGFGLVDSYRTTLTGLSDLERQALFMVSIPAPLSQLGFGDELRTALLKLSAALPDTSRDESERVHQRIFLDSTWWNQTVGTLPYLQELYKAIWDDHPIRISYQFVGNFTFEQIVDPYGLVAKAGIWYLVYKYHGRIRVLTVKELTDVSIISETFMRSSDFNLQLFWKDWCKQQELSQKFYTTIAFVNSKILPQIKNEFGGPKLLKDDKYLDHKRPGWVAVELAFRSLPDARTRLLPFGGSIEVLIPLPLRLSLQDYAKQISAVYE
jgi:predicted DNA-binding transcriptional regulator YafY